MMYGVAICGWTVGIYLLQILWDNMRLIFVSYQKYVAIYALCTGLVSFVGKFAEYYQKIHFGLYQGFLIFYT